MSDETNAEDLALLNEYTRTLVKYLGSAHIEWLKTTSAKDSGLVRSAMHVATRSLHNAFKVPDTDDSKDITTFLDALADAYVLPTTKPEAKEVTKKELLS